MISLTTCSMYDSIRLSQDYPNPLDSDTVIAYEIGANAVADVVMYDSNGRKVKTLVSRSRMRRRRD